MNQVTGSRQKRRRGEKRKRKKRDTEPNPVDKGRMINVVAKFTLDRLKTGASVILADITMNRISRTIVLHAQV